MSHLQRRARREQSAGPAAPTPAQTVPRPVPPPVPQQSPPTMSRPAPAPVSAAPPAHRIAPQPVPQPWPAAPPRPASPPPAPTGLKLRLVTKTGERLSLRVFWGEWNKMDASKHEGWPYHNAQAFLRDVNDPASDISIHEVDEAEYRSYLGKWPTKCDHCTEAVPPFGTEDVCYQLFADTLWDGRIHQPGDVFWAPWFNHTDCRDAFVVILPNGMPWSNHYIATNCSHPDKKTPEGHKIQHHCWTTTGTPPDITVSPSIQMGQGPGSWHGFVRAGVLVPA